MLKTFLKVVVLVLAVLPIWLTVLAFGEESNELETSVQQVALVEPVLTAPQTQQAQQQLKAARIPVAAWKDRLNTKLLALKDRKIQITELLSTNENLSDESLLKSDFRVDVSGIKPNATSVITLEFMDAEGRLSRLIRLPVKAFVQSQVLVATKTLAPGAILQASDVKAEWRETNLYQSNLSSTEVVVGRAIRNTIHEGDIVSDNQLAKETLVARGDRVKILVTSKGLTLSAIGIAQEPGSKGQTIKVLNADSKKELLATVVESKSVEVKL